MAWAWAAGAAGVGLVGVAGVLLAGAGFVAGVPGLAGVPVSALGAADVGLTPFVSSPDDMALPPEADVGADCEELPESDEEPLAGAGAETEELPVEPSELDPVVLIDVSLALCANAGASGAMTMSTTRKRAAQLKAARSE